MVAPCVVPELPLGWFSLHSSCVCISFSGGANPRVQLGTDLAETIGEGTCMGAEYLLGVSYLDPVFFGGDRRQKISQLAPIWFLASMLLGRV